MKKNKSLLLLILMLFLSLILLTGCGTDTENENEDSLESLYSEGIDRNGFWKGIKALDYVENFDYLGIKIPADIHQISDKELQAHIDLLMESYVRNKITDRAVADGDTVNIDYEGLINGNTFQGNSTMGAGVDVTIEESEDTDGVTLSFLDDFVKALIGKMPESTLEIKVTFPDDYHEETVRGKEAVFETTINYIVERDEVTDAFVAKKLSESNGWTTVEEMRKEIRTGMQKSRVQEYMDEFLSTEVSVKSIPDRLIKYQEDILLHGHQQSADSRGIALEDYLLEYEKFTSVEKCLEASHDEFIKNATVSLALQAVAEDVGISVDDADVEQYSVEHLWSTDVSVLTEEYGLPYMKRVALAQKAIDYIVENAVLL